VIGEQRSGSGNRITAIILCGGRSTRMGRDKATLLFGDETMLDRILRIVRAVADDVMVVGRRDQSASTIHDAVEDEGPLAGIAAGLAASTTDLNYVVACDMPLIKPAVLERLAAMIENDDVCVAVVDGHASALCGVYRSRIAKDAQALFESGERRVMRLLDQVTTKRVDAAVFRDIDPDLDTFISVDTPEKYADALVRLKPDPHNSSP
jgi:molybdenum cofactor guanylyltransferase